MATDCPRCDYECFCTNRVKEPRFCTRVCYYSATGEGHTLAIVIAPCPVSAERLFIKHFGEWLNQGAENHAEMPSGEAAPFCKYVPEAVFRKAAEVPNFVYHSCWHYNLS